MPELKKAIEEFMRAWNEHPQPFVWTAKLEEIPKKFDRAQAKVEQIKPRSTLSRGKKNVTNLQSYLRHNTLALVSAMDVEDLDRCLERTQLAIFVPSPELP